MDDVAWEIAHSVETTASPVFAWAYSTNIANWDDPPAEFELDGPFVAGSRGTTRVPGQEPRHWRLREVHTMKSYVIEAPADRAVMTFEWRFEGRRGGGTRLTQHIVLKGENAAAYVAEVQAAFAPNLATGMTRIAKAMERAEPSS